MQSKLAMLAISVLLTTLLLTACGDGNGPTIIDPPPPPPPASFVVSQTGPAQLGISPSPAHFFRLRFPVRINETGGGTGGNVDFARLELLLAGQEIERAETTAADIIAQRGTNHINAGGSFEVNLDFDFNSVDFDDGDITIGLTDDRGTSSTLDFNPGDDIVIVPGVLELGGQFWKYRR